MIVLVRDRHELQISFVIGYAPMDLSHIVEKPFKGIPSDIGKGHMLAWLFNVHDHEIPHHVLRSETKPVVNLRAHAAVRNPYYAPHGNVSVGWFTLRRIFITIRLPHPA